jgi:hypothetical protein
MDHRDVAVGQDHVDSERPPGDHDVVLALGGGTEHRPNFRLVCRCR